MQKALIRFFERIWYGRSSVGLLFVPISWLYALLVALRRRTAGGGTASAVPVIVVGNLTVGGTGKTPIVGWLVEQLKARGAKPGIVTRGYHGTATNAPIRVDSDSKPAEVGDEAVLLARRLQCPVVACADRMSAIRTLLSSGDVDVVVSDDGLQHFAMRADCEIVVVDGVRGLGNGRLLPAGPLRESAGRLQHADAVLINGQGWHYPGARTFELRCTNVVQLHDGAARQLAEFSGARVHAHAAIGHPARFFQLLKNAGCSVNEHAWPDHAEIPPDRLATANDEPVLITEKDAVKLPQPVSAGIWSVNVEVDFTPADAEWLLTRVMERIARE